MKHTAVIMLALLAGCGSSQQAAEDAAMLAQARELVALTEHQVTVREAQQPLLEHDAATTDEQREVARLELDAAQAELKRLRQWETEFSAAIETNDSARLEKLRGQFEPMVKRLR